MVGVCHCCCSGLTISFIARTAASFWSALWRQSLWKSGGVGQFAVRFRVAFNIRAGVANADW